MSLSIFLDKLEVAEKPEDVFSLIVEYLSQFGIQQIYYVFIPPESLLDLSKLELRHTGFDDFPEIITFAEDFIRSKPKTSNAKMQNGNGSDRHFRGDAVYNLVFEELNQKILSLFRAKNIKPGYRIPVYGPNQMSGIIDIGLPLGEDGIQAFPEALSNSHLQTVCQMAHLKYCTVKPEEILDSVKFTRQEMKVMNRLVEGCSNSEIALSMEVSKHTIDSYMRRIFLKLNAQNRVSAAIKCYELNSISPSTTHPFLEKIANRRKSRTGTTGVAE
jgi:DNA-binding CsgD family transcriptional regulator